MTASLRFAQSTSAGLPCYKILCSGILIVPLPYGMCHKVSHKGRHIFEWLHPRQHRSAVDVTWDSRGLSLSVLFLRLSGSGAQSSPFMVLLSLRKVVLLRYCLCIWHPCRKRMQESILHTRWVACEHRYSWTKKREFLVEDTWKVTLVRSSLVWPSSFSRVERIIGKKTRRRIL